MSVQQSEGFVRKAALLAVQDERETPITKRDTGFSSRFVRVR